MLGTPRARSCALLFVTVLLGQPTIVAAQVRSDAGLPPTVSLPSELDAVLRGYEAAWGARDAAGLASLFTEDGFVLRPGHPPVHGRAAIREAYADSGGLLSLRAYAFHTEGAAGYIIGGYASDPESPAVGKFVLTLRRGPAGAWLITADIDNGN